MFLETQLQSISNKKQASLLKSIKKQKYLVLMVLPFVIWIFIFAYLPLWGWIMAFQNYFPGKSLFDQKWVGLKNFIDLFLDKRFYLVLTNTVSMSLLQIFFSGFIAPIFFAILLNEVKNAKFKKTIQTVSYLPHFVSWVVVAGMFIQFLAPETGVFNRLLIDMGILEKPIHFFAEQKYFYAIVTIADVWKETGWNAIIYLAAMAGINMELYEAATVDGCGRIGKIWHITLPGIRPTIVVLLILLVGGIMNTGFEKQFLFSNPLLIDRAEVIDLYVLNYGLNLQRYSFGTAVGIFKSVIAIALIFTTNLIAKKTANESLI